MMRGLVLAMAVVLAAGCNKGAGEDQCKKLMEHMLDLEIARSGAKGSGAEALPPEVTEKNAKQKTAALELKSAEFVTLCNEKIDKKRIECALAAKDFEALEKCDK